MQRPGTHGTNWLQEPRHIAPPLGRPPPPAPPTRPLAPPLSQPPPRPPPPRPPSSHPLPPLPPPHPPPPLPTSLPPSPPSSTFPPPPPPLPPPSNEQPPLPPPPDKQDPNAQESPNPPETGSKISTTSDKRRSSAEKSPTTEVKGFGGMRFIGSGTGLGKRPPGGTISMKFGGTKPVPGAKKSKPVVMKPELVSQAFGNESDEEEEMPPEAKLRMRNVGKDTPTSAGPNSFYKGKMGFSDPRAGYKRYNDDD